MTSALATAYVLVGCATQETRVADTKWPQAVIHASKSNVHDALIAGFVDAGMTIENSGDSLIQGRAPSSRPELVKALGGCPSCADPYMKINVVITSTDGGTLVVCQYWTMVPQSNGTETRFEMNGNGDFNNIQKALWALRDRYASNPTNVQPKTSSSAKTIDQLNFESAASNALAEFHKAEKAEDWQQMCVQAGNVANAALRLGQEQTYQWWKDLQTRRCRTSNAIKNIE